MSTERIYVSVRYFEIPPGSTGRALLAHIVSLVVAVSVIWWSLWHPLTASADEAALIVALVALGSAAVDGLTPRAPILNAPLLPRVVLYLQSLWLIAIALWLLIRGTAEQSSVQQGSGIWLADLLTNLDPWIGIAAAAFIAVQLGVLLSRTIRLMNAYSRASGGARGAAAAREKVTPVG